LLKTGGGFTLKAIGMKSIKRIPRYPILFVGLVLGLILFSGASLPAYAAPPFNTGGQNTAPYWCGGPNDRVYMSINIGCKGAGNALTDMTFAIIRFLSVGVGLIIIGSTVWAGLQYTLSRDDPGGVAKAKERLQNNFIALLVFIFAAAILNFVVPGQFLQ
jgi:hypothetical protein